MRPYYAILLALCNAAYADSVPELEGTAIQGGVMRGQVEPGSTIHFNGTPIRVNPNGQYIIGFDRDEPEQATLEIHRQGGDRERYELRVTRRTYHEQRIDGLPPKKVTPDEKDLQRIRKETRLVVAARKQDLPMDWFAGTFRWPLYGRISGVYGSRRILNGKPRRPHYGIDIAAPTGTIVRAPASGQVTLAHTDMFFSGGTLILDHGHGLSSTMLHLSRILVQQGDFVQQGEPIAEVGATGRATGPHLDWRMNLFKRHIDPESMAGPMPVAL